MQDDLLLLKTGGQVVYHGPLGRDGQDVIRYFEARCGAEPIGLGENAATWMLRVMTERQTIKKDDDDQADLTDIYRASPMYAQLLEDIDNGETTVQAARHIVFESSFATSPRHRREQINARLRKIYWRSPAYNLARIMVSLVIAFVLGSVFLLKRDNAAERRLTEMDMRARLSIIFMGFIITGIMAILSVLPVITKIRDMYYRHRDAGMYDSVSIGLALGVAEKWFIVLSTALFCVVFLVTSGIGADDGDPIVRPIAFWVRFHHLIF
jgi:ABC-2 type transporter